jgi:hypothetical protein
MVITIDGSRIRRVEEYNNHVHVAPLLQMLGMPPKQPE